MNHFIPLLLGSSLVFGCTSSDGASDPETTLPDGPDGGTAEGTVNGLPASEYYGQFVWEETETYVSGAAAFASQTDGRNAFLAHVFLLENGDTYVFYAEGEGEVTASGHSLNLFGDSYKRRQGSWSIDGTKLLIGDWLSCDGLTFNDADALRCSLDASIVTPAAVGASGFFKPGFGASTPLDSEWADYQ